jgi:hypothetical protein
MSPFGWSVSMRVGVGCDSLRYVLLGIALGRARVILWWIACLLISGSFVQAVSYPTHHGFL